MRKESQNQKKIHKRDNELDSNSEEEIKDFYDTDHLIDLQTQELNQETGF